MISDVQQETSPAVASRHAFAKQHDVVKQLIHFRRRLQQRHQHRALPHGQTVSTTCLLCRNTHVRRKQRRTFIMCEKLRVHFTIWNVVLLSNPVEISAPATASLQLCFSSPSMQVDS